MTVGFIFVDDIGEYCAVFTTVVSGVSKVLHNFCSYKLREKKV
jgi:hypothetical protein